MQNAGLLTIGMAGRSGSVFLNVVLILTLIRALRYNGPVTRAMVGYVAGSSLAILWNMVGVAEYLVDFLPGIALIDVVRDWAIIPQIALIAATVNLIVAIRGWPWTRYPEVPPVSKTFNHRRPEDKEAD